MLVWWWSGATWRGSYHGIVVQQNSRVFRDVIGASVQITFEIVDNRPGPSLANKSYKVKLRSGRRLLFEQEYAAAGEYTVTVASPSRRQFSTLVLEMVNEHGQVRSQQPCLPQVACMYRGDRIVVYGILEWAFSRKWLGFTIQTHIFSESSRE
jgi:hypothetical protein